MIFVYQGRVADPLSHLTVGCPVLAFCARAGATKNCSQLIKSPKLPSVKVRGFHPLKTEKGGAPSSVVVLEEREKLGHPPEREHDGVGGDHEHLRF